MSKDKQRELLIDFMNTTEKDAETHFRIVDNDRLIMGFIIPKIREYGIALTSKNNVVGDPDVIANLHYSLILRLIVEIRSVTELSTEGVLENLIRRLINDKHHIAQLKSLGTHTKVKAYKDF